jgi:hypothetical protein
MRRFTKNIGMLLLAIWLILTGLIALFGLSFAGLGTILGLLAIAAGLFFLLGRYKIQPQVCLMKRLFFKTLFHHSPLIPWQSPGHHGAHFI